MRNVSFDSGEYELGEFENPSVEGSILTGCIKAEGSTPLKFFGDAMVEGFNCEGDLKHEEMVFASECPLREEAIDLLMRAWEHENGPITRLEVDAIFAELDRKHPLPPKTYRTDSDRRGSDE